jgi:demethylmenaquinone methyltransferase/2-methoxy-6-polyprenyl-1,4-benzoquinol methylase
VLWCNGDGTRLPLADASVDAVTISFGLRNLPDPVAGLRELARVTKPGGRLLVLEFSHPTWAPFRTVYLRYLLGLVPRLATLVTSDPAAYRYLAESIVAWPDQEALARRIAEAGWSGSRWKNLTGGIVAAHHAVR